MHFVDSTRVDQWAGGPRELMVSFLYPAEAPVGRLAPYLSEVETQAVLDMQGLTTVDAAVIAATRTNAYTNAPPAREPRPFPLVVLSPGFGSPRKSMSTLAEDVASHGYVVALIDHAYEAAAITYPDGRVQRCLACQQAGIGSVARVPRGRAADVSFLLDRIGTWRNSRLIDRQRIGMAGHSIGGNAAAETMQTDSRVLVGANFDGPFFAPLTGLSRPFLMVGSAAHTPTSPDYTWPQAWQALTGPKHWVTLAHANHLSFTDSPLLADQLGFPGNPELSGPRVVEITRGLLVGFLDTYLKGHQTTQAGYPEIDTWRYGQPLRVRRLC